jgi:hypothetical protein
VHYSSQRVLADGRVRTVSIGCASGLFGLIIYLLLFWWYANTVIARPEPTLYVNFFWGLLHGIFAVPSFILSLFSDNVAIYQTPNSGGWYNFGFLIGVGAFTSSARASR